MRQSGFVEAWGLYERQLMCQAVVRLWAVLTWLFFSIAQMDLENAPLLGAPFLAL